MKNYLSLAGALALALTFTGCAVFQSAVPKNTVKLTVPIFGANGALLSQATFEGSFAKDNNLGGVTFTYDGKTFSGSLTNLCNTNSPTVIGTGLQGQADLATAIGTQVVNGVNAGVSAVGKAAGAAVKTP